MNIKKILIVNESSTFCGVDEYCLQLYSLFKDSLDFYFLIKKGSDFNKKLNTLCVNNIYFIKPYDFCKYKRILIKHAIDIVHIHTAKSYYLNLFSKFVNKNILTVITRHNGFKLNYFPNNIFLKKTDIIIAVSDFVKKQITNQFKNNEKVRRIYNSYNVNNLNLSRSYNTKLRVGYIGRIIYEKGLHKLISSLKYINSNYELNIAGKFSNDKYKKLIKNIINNNNLEEKINFLGFINNKEEFYSNIDVLVVPSLISWQEAFGLIVIEALAHKVPVIAFESGALPEIINDKYGFIVKNEDEIELGKLLNDISFNKSKLKHISNISKDYIVKNFSEKIFKEHYSKIYIKGN